MNIFIKKNFWGLDFFFVRKNLFFREGIYNSNKLFVKNTIWIILLRENNKIGIGECNPLLLKDKFMKNYNNIEYEINNILKLNYPHDLKLRHYRKFPSPNPSILFALEQAIFSLKSKFPILYASPFTKGLRGIPLNNLIWLDFYKKRSQKELLKIIEKKMIFGFRSFKIKIEKKLLDNLCCFLTELEKKYPFIQIKLDANSCFNNVNDTLYFINRELNNFKSIYYIEQPIAPGNWGDMALICRNSILPIALDEELIGINKLYKKKELLNFIKPDFLIIRPSVNGGFFESEEWILEANKRKIKWCVSSSLDSNIGINAISQWTFVMSQKYKENNSYFHGLYTGNIYKNEISPKLKLKIKKGSIWMNKFINFEYQKNEFYPYPYNYL
ncbi:enolase-like domain-containing protein [Blattabacterium cuenoti]|uniref:O-succinylbenzoate synthase n=1 Tax=Blattabacterium cuenoti TaxID=1653831 RepID=UPI00163B6526|nr:O-succinylbenzoate synthase [Blattabacterium cuenoti]